jgi:Tol biopolymer transport system component
MTKQTSPDLLDLAEAVADGALRADDAERQVRAALGPDHDDASEKAARDLRQLIVAASAVRSHVRATREALTAESPDLAHANASIATIVPGPVRAGAARRRSSRGGDGRAPRRTWLLVAATLAIGTGLIGASVVGGRLVTPNPVPSLPNAVADASASPESSPNPTAVQPKPGMFAFIKGVGYAGQLWIANTDGTGAHQLAPDLAGSKGTPSWSADGTRLVFSLTPMGSGGMASGYPNPEDGGSRLYLTDASGSAPKLVDTGCVAPCSGDSDAAFSPDGTRLVFVRTKFLPARIVDNPKGTGPGPWTPYARVLATIDLSTGRVVELGSTLVSEVSGNFQGFLPRDYHPRWSPDGTQIVFTQDVPGSVPALGPVPAVFVVDADGRNLRKIGLPAQSADWSPDGTRIVFGSVSHVVVSSGPNAPWFRQYFDIYTIRPDGTDPRRLTSDRVSQAPTWTAGGRIGFFRDPMLVNGVVGSMEPRQLWIMDADGGNATQLSVPQQLVDAWPISWPPQP